MDFKIKFKAGYLVLFAGIAFFIFMGGIIIGASLDWSSDKIIKPFACLVGTAISVLATIALFMGINTASRNNSKIDIDSFTEAAINDAIEDKWNEVKKQVMKG